MNRSILAAAVLLSAAPLAAQSTTQDELEARHDRALAAGYKALFLCSAIANAEANGAARTPESVEQWELTGVQAPLDAIMPDLEHRIYRSGDGAGALARVEVDWSEDMPPRIARHRETGGCSQEPVGQPAGPQDHELQRSHPDAIVNAHTRINPPALKRVFDASMQGAYGEGTRTTAVIASDQGGDGYWQYADPQIGPVTPQRTWSVAKSIAATLVGAAVHRAGIDVNASAGLGADEADPRRAITVDHLLRMASGRYSDTPGNRTDPLYFGGATVEETALHWPLVHAPGAVYRYANNDTLAAVKAIEETFAEYPPAKLFEQLGMTNTVAETDWQGDYILSSQVWATAPDLMRLGQLYLNDGVLPNGERVLPEGWAEYVSAPSGPQPDGPFGYGAGFWLFNKSAGIPADTFAAMGNRGQFIVIVPSLNIVIVRRGEDPTGSRFDIAAFTSDVLESLGK